MFSRYTYVLGDSSHLSAYAWCVGYAQGLVESSQLIKDLGFNITTSIYTDQLESQLGRWFNKIVESITLFRSVQRMMIEEGSIRVQNLNPNDLESCRRVGRQTPTEDKNYSFIVWFSKTGQVVPVEFYSVNGESIAKEKGEKYYLQVLEGKLYLKAVGLDKRLLINENYWRYEKQVRADVETAFLRFEDHTDGWFKRLNKK